MNIFHFISVFIHVTAAMLWLGGMLFLGVVGAPVLRAVEPAALRQSLFHHLGLRFRTIGWWCIGVLIVTGVTNLAARGQLRWELLGAPTFWESGAGRVLALKLACVTAMVTMSAIHDFHLGPAAGRATPGSDEARALRMRAANLARINAVIGLVLIGVAVRLARG